MKLLSKKSVFHATISVVLSKSHLLWFQLPDSGKMKDTNSSMSRDGKSHQRKAVFETLSVYVQLSRTKANPRSRLYLCPQPGAVSQCLSAAVLVGTVPQGRWDTGKGAECLGMGGHMEHTNMSLLQAHPGARLSPELTLTRNKNFILLKLDNY